jgi:ribonucleoside-diphosphate reductase alpha chain
LSEVVVRPDDTLNDLKRKVKYATILGTLQSTLTDFRYLSAAWKKNTEEERLLGVSLTGIMDHPVLSGAEHPAAMSGSEGTAGLESWLTELKEYAVEVNKEWAAKLGVTPSSAITCVKPSGTVSQLVDCASGIHPRYSKYYIRTVRSDQKDPLSQFLIDQGVPYEPDVMKPNDTYVFSFPMKAPEDSVMRDDRTAIQQLEMWKTYQQHWCEHKPSITVYVKEEEWLEVGAWVYENFDYMSGVSFLPHSDHTYKQAPYQEITEEEYTSFPKITLNWDEFFNGGYETQDETKGSQEMACTGGACEIL